LLFDVPFAGPAAMAAALIATPAEPVPSACMNLRLLAFIF
jgi:hypothetical protein